MTVITGFDSVEEARGHVKNIVRFLPPSGIEVWLLDPPGILIEGAGLSFSQRDHIAPEPLLLAEYGASVPPDRETGYMKLELLYGGIY